MTRRMTSTIVLTLSLLISLVSFPLTAQGQQRLKRVADTGVITLGEEQILRLTITSFSGNDTFTYQFRRIVYMPLGCNAGECKLSVASESLSEPVTLSPGEAAAINIDAGAGTDTVRALVLSNNLNVKVTAMIVYKPTGNIIAILYP